MTECKPKRREHGGSPTQHQAHILRGNRANLEKLGWLEATEHFVLHHDEVDQGIQAIHQAKHILMTATHPFGDTWDEKAKSSSANSKLIVTLEAIAAALKPILKGQNPDTLILPTYAKRNKRKNDPVIIETDRRILSALDCWHQNIPDQKLPFKRFAHLLSLWNVKGRGERTLQNMWRDRPEGYAYDVSEHASEFYHVLIKNIHNSDALRRSITAIGIEEALLETIKNLF